MLLKCVVLESIAQAFFALMSCVSRCEGKRDKDRLMIDDADRIFNASKPQAEFQAECVGQRCINLKQSSMVMRRLRYQ
jgi:hypothetical protein